MRCLVLIVLAACSDGGVSTHQSWDDALATFADAHCRWNATCQGYSPDPMCPSYVAEVMNTDTKPELDAAAQARCIACMQAYTDAYGADTTPCVGTMTYDQAQAAHAACAPDYCPELHDLPEHTIATQ